MKAVFTRFNAATAALILVVGSAAYYCWPNQSPRHGERQHTTTALYEKPLEEFPIGEGPRVILLPVTMNGRTLLFLVDTGAWKSAIDSSLISELGPRMGKTTMLTSAGSSEVELYGWPRASLGKLEITGLESVFCHDFTPFRYASGKEIYGTLGIDFLRRYALEIDFDGGKIRLWDHAPDAWKTSAQPVSITYDQSNRPQIHLIAGGSKSVDFQIDTGANGSALFEGAFDELRDRGEIKIGLDYAVATGAGNIRGRTGYLSQLKLQELTNENLRFDRDRFSLLGLNYLSRFKVRLDFENNAAYFLKGRRFSTPDPTGTSGMSIVHVNGQKIVRSVEPGGPAANQRILPGDVIVQVDGHDANEYDMVALREVLTQTPGGSVPLRLRRNADVYTATVEIQSRLIR